MIKKAIFITLLLTGLSSFAEEVPVTITPIHKISTTDKNLQEGDTVEFKDIKTGEIILGTIREITPNGFNGQQATLDITNFRYKNSTKNLNGGIYIKGGEHTKYQAMADYGLAPATDFIRGGEVILKPEKTKLTIVLNDYINSEDTPVRIKPSQKISTAYDEIEINDKIKFTVLNDVFKNGNLYIRKDTPAYGVVDYVSENGWASDNAEINFKNFITKDITGKTIKIYTPTAINGFEILKYKGNRIAQFFNYAGVIFRGKEIDILPEKDNVIINIWL